jgi:hypothetical protein
VSARAGTCGTGNIHYGDELSVLRGVLASEVDSLKVVRPSDYPTRHDTARIPELDDAASEAA